MEKKNELKLYNQDYYKQHYENNKKEILLYNKDNYIFNNYKPRKEINNDLIKIEKRLITISFD